MNFVCMNCGCETDDAPMEDYGAYHEKRGRKCPACKHRNMRSFDEEDRARDLTKLKRWKEWAAQEP